LFLWAARKRALRPLGKTSSPHEGHLSSSPMAILQQVVKVVLFVDDE